MCDYFSNDKKYYLKLRHNILNNIYMIQFHLCDTFVKNIKGQAFKKLVYNKISENQELSVLCNTASLSFVSSNIWTLKTYYPITKTIIEEQNINIYNNEVKVLFVRDIIGNKNVEYSYVKNIYPQLKNGDWLKNNPLPEIDKINFIEKYKFEHSKVEGKLDFPPQELTSWLEDFKIEPKNEIFETEDWVKYALSTSLTEGMIDKRVDIFRIVLSDIIKCIIKGEIIKEENGISVLKYTNDDIGIIYCKMTLNNENDIFILFNGAIISKQNSHWQKALTDIQSNEIDFTNSKESISRKAFRAYPKWTINNYDDWYPIQKSKEFSNLSLTSEQIDFFHEFKFPYYINGQAGSGKSLLLYYIFANSYYYKCQDEIKGDIIFLTENETLLKHSEVSVFDLLTNNTEFKVSIELASQCIKNNFNSFKRFLVEMLPENNKSNFKDNKYLDFSKFKQRYENSNLPKHIIDKYSAEESWFTIITYIYGYNLDEKITSENYVDAIPKKSRIIPKNKFIGIEENVLPFYEKLINEENYWDKLKIIRYITENISIKKKYSVIICDEAQDFCRVELRFILKLSKYLEYDLSKTDEVPIVFAGDPNQTVNPTGFRQGEMTSMLYEELQKKPKFHNPSFNYRSAQPVVSIANFVQYHRMKNLGIKQVQPQEAKRPNSDSNRNFNVFLDYNSIEQDLELKQDLIEKLEHKIFIIPVNAQEKEAYIKNHTILSLIKEVEVKTAVEAKGAEYEQVVLFGFGDYFTKNFKSLSENKQNTDDLFRRGVFFNKLYVGLTRAQTELIIIDSKQSEKMFWKILINNMDISTEKWLILNDYKDDVILYNPGTIKDKIDNSTKDNAYKNAQQDKKQGLYDNNPARLKVAAKQFIKIGEKELAYECLALSEELKENWQSAADYYLNATLKNPKYEEAAICLFKGRFFNELVSRVGRNLRTTEQDIRIIISRLINGEKLMKQDIFILIQNKDKLDEITKDLEWRDELINQFILSSNAIQLLEQKKDLVTVLEYIAKSNDFNLWSQIADIRFDLKHYKEAIDAWNKNNIFVDNEKYYISQVELAKQNNNFEATVLWLDALFKYKDANAKTSILNEIINIHKQYNDNNNSSDYYLVVFVAFIIQQPHDVEVVNLSSFIETKLIDDKNKLIELYERILENEILNDKIAVFIIERWAKCQWKSEKERLNLEKLNKIYLQFSEKHSIIYKEFTSEELENISESPEEINWKPLEQLKNITFHNFRRFKKLTISNIGQYNLIVGDNNVGKTSLLEALLFTHIKEQFVENIAFAHIERKNITRTSIGNEMKYFIPSNFVIDDFIRKDAQPKELIFELHDKRNSWNFKIRTATREEVLKKNNSIINIDTDDFLGIVSSGLGTDIVELSLIIKKLNPENLIKSPLIPFGKGFGKDLALIYYENIEKVKSERISFMKSMEIFIPNITRINVNTEKGEIDIEEDGFDVSAPLHQYGEGANKLFRILVQITLQKEKRLLIDEIDAGIHYSHFPTFWKTILSVADRNNVQIFASTHNIECVNYFSEILQEDKYNVFQKKSRIITLEKLPDKNIIAYTRIFNEFEYELSNEFEIRGGEL